MAISKLIIAGAALALGTGVAFAQPDPGQGATPAQPADPATAATPADPSTGTSAVPATPADPATPATPPSAQPTDTDQPAATMSGTDATKGDLKSKKKKKVTKPD
jgi:hypothetical protein